MFHIYSKSLFCISWQSAFWKVDGLIMISELINNNENLQNLLGYNKPLSCVTSFQNLNWFVKIIRTTLITWRIKFISIRKLESGIDTLNLSTWTNSKTTILVRISITRSWKQTENIQLTFINNVKEQKCSQGSVLFTDNPQASKYNKVHMKPHTYLLLQCHHILIQSLILYRTSKATRLKL
jgi:hypothetical protein